MSKWLARYIRTKDETTLPGKTSAIKQSRWIDGLHIFVLTSFAVAQPIYDRLSERTSLLVDLHMDYRSLYVIAAILSLVLPTFLVAIEWLIGRLWRRAYHSVHLVLVFVLCLLQLLPVAKLAVIFSGGLIACVGVLGSVIAVWCYHHLHSVRSIVTIAAPGVVLFPALFLIQGSSRLTASLPSAIRTEKWRPVPVVMVVFDEFSGTGLMTPDRQIDAERFPNIAALCQQATWYRNASGVHHMTEYALPSIISGKYPTPNFNIPTIGDFPQNIFSVLSLAGNYETAIFEPISRLARTSESTVPSSAARWQQVRFLADTLARVYLFHVVPSDYAIKLPAIPMAWFGVSTGITVDRTLHRGVFRYDWGNERHAQFEHFLNCIDGAPRPTLHFLHMLIPHVPWCYLPSGKRYAPDGSNWDLLELTTHGGVGDGWGQDDLEAAQNQQRHLLQLMYVDSLIGKLTAHLKETGQFDDCLLILTADHGISFRKNQPRREIVEKNQDEILSIPLIIKRPRQVEGEVSDRIVQSVDILPTIADVVGIQLNGACDGVSMLDDSKPQRTQLTYAALGTRRQVDPSVIINSPAPQTIRDRFGDAADPQALYRIGVHPELIGRTPSSLQLGAGSPIDLTVTRYGDVVDDAAPVQIPCLYEGTIRTDIPLSESPVALAVAVNGKIAAVTRTYTQAGFLNQWAIMLPESAYRPGKNDVRFFRVTGTAPDWILTPCNVHPSQTNSQRDTTAN